jgi:hypothetical protein
MDLLSLRVVVCLAGNALVGPQVAASLGQLWVHVLAPDRNLKMRFLNALLRPFEEASTLGGAAAGGCSMSGLYLGTYIRDVSMSAACRLRVNCLNVLCLNGKCVLLPLPGFRMFPLTAMLCR